MVDETVNTQSSDEEYEYEYIELAEGEELPADADYEYEYIEIPAESVPHEEPMVEQQPMVETVSVSEESVVQAVSEPAPVSVPQEVVGEPVVSPVSEVAEVLSESVVGEVSPVSVEGVSAVAEAVPVTEAVPVQESISETSKTVVETTTSFVQEITPEPVVSETPVVVEPLREDDNSILEPTPNEESLSEMLVDVSETENVVAPTAEAEVDLEKELFGTEAPVNIDEVPFIDVAQPHYEEAVVSVQETAEVSEEPEDVIVETSVQEAVSEPIVQTVAEQNESVVDPVIEFGLGSIPQEVVDEAVVVPTPVVPVLEEENVSASTVEEEIPKSFVSVDEAPVVLTEENIAVSESLPIDETKIEVVRDVLSDNAVSELNQSAIIEEEVAVDTVPEVEIQSSAAEIVSEPAIDENQVIETINTEEVAVSVSAEEVAEPIIETISASVVSQEPVETPDVSDIVTEPEIVQDDVSFQILSVTTESYQAYKNASKIFGKASGIQVFQGDENSRSVVLDDVDYKEKELENWSLIVFKTALISLPSGNSSVRLEKNVDTVRYARIVQNGRSELSVFNEEELNIVPNSSNFIEGRNHFIYAQSGQNTGIVVNDFENISLADKEGCVVSFKTPVSGILVGSGNAKLYFSEVSEFVIPTTDMVREDADKQQAQNAKWYSGSLNDKYFELSAEAVSCEFSGNDEVRSIHVNVGTSTYGWNVTFDNGIVMSLRDLQEFQNKHGALPSVNGTISHGQLICKFSNIEKIVIYEIPQYFAYGRM